MPSIKVRTGVTLSFAERGGPTRPCVVFHPGPTDSWPSYGPVLDALPPIVRAIAISPRGHGDSEKPDAGYRVEDFADDVVALLDELGIARAALAGHSGSCLVARRVAIEHPERVSGLILEASPTTLVGDPGLSGFIESIVSSLSDPVDPDFVRSFIEGTSSANVDAATIDERVAEVLKVPALVWREMFAGIVTYDDLADLDAFNVPTLLIWGDADPVVSRDMQDDLATRMSAELVVYPGIGHTPRWEEPASFAADVAAFVAHIS